MTTRWAAAKLGLWFSEFHTDTQDGCFMFREKDESLNYDPSWLRVDFQSYSLVQQ